MGSVKREIIYFDTEGPDNLDQTLEIVCGRWREEKQLSVLCFTWGGESAIRLKEMTEGQCAVIAVTYPHYQLFGQSDKGMKYPPISCQETRERLEAAGIRIVAGIQAFDDIIIPGVSSVKARTIQESLSVVSGGLPLCANAVLMACSAGIVRPQQRVIAFSADTAIVAVASLHTHMFHPGEGMEIEEILCKPRNLTQTRPREEWKHLVEEEKEREESC